MINISEKASNILISLEDWVSVGLDAAVWKWLVETVLFDQHHPVRIVKVFGQDVCHSNEYLVTLGHITLGKFQTRDAAEQAVSFLVLFGASYTPYHIGYQKYQ